MEYSFDNITNPYGANTTVMLPGNCNAHCEFCFWDRDEAKIPVPVDYTNMVFASLRNLPDHFSVLSISGGEPTLSPYFVRFMKELAVFRDVRQLDRVVLTTHGGNILRNLHLISGVVDHINISRHGIGSEANYEIFKTNKIPSDNQLKNIIGEIHRSTRCDVTLNCVVPYDVSVQFCEEFIEYAKSLGADAVSFRKEASDALPTEAEKEFVRKHGAIGETKCEVCRGLTQRVNGFDVRWKGSVGEPSLETGGVYEVVYHPDGLPYADWSRVMPLEIDIVNEWPPKLEIKKKKVSIKSTHRSGCGSGGGCGSSSSSSGCGSGGGCGR